MYRLQLNSGRAYAASVVLPSGTFWMLGGAGYNSILDSTEYVTYNVSTKKWKTRPGPTLPFPMMGHCAVLSRDGHKPIFRIRLRQPRLPADRAALLCCAKSPLPVTDL